MFNKKQVSYVVWALGNHIGTITKRTKNEELAAIRQSLTLATTGALVYHGYIDLTANVDVIVNQEVFEAIKKLYPDNVEVRKKFKDGLPTEFTIEKVVLNISGVPILIWVYDLASDSIQDPEQGFFVQSVKEVLDFKQTLGRPNDLLVIEQVTTYRKENLAPKDLELITQKEALI